MIDALLQDLGTAEAALELPSVAYDGQPEEIHGSDEGAEPSRVPEHSCLPGEDLVDISAW